MYVFIYCYTIYYIYMLYGVSFLKTALIVIMLIKTIRGKKKSPTICIKKC